VETGRIHRICRELSLRSEELRRRSIEIRARIRRQHAFNLGPPPTSQRETLTIRAAARRSRRRSQTLVAEAQELHDRARDVIQQRWAKPHAA
jgi:hypothetical protein